MNRNQDTMTLSSQNSFWMAALASFLSITAGTGTVYACDERQISPSIVVRYNYSLPSTNVQSVVYASPRKKNFRESYAKMAKSKWFKEAYENKSVGELIEIE